MVDAVGTGALLAADSGPELPTVNDFLPPEILFQGTPFAINRIILIRIVATVVLLVVLGITAKRAKLIPGRWQGVVEMGIDFVRDSVVYQVMGELRGKRYVPMISTLFFTIFVFNLCGIIPGMNMAATATVVMRWCSRSGCSSSTGSPQHARRACGATSATSASPRECRGRCTSCLAPIQLCELVLIRPASLTIRLFANMISGHLLVASCLAFAQYWVIDAINKLAGIPVGALWFVFGLVLTLFEAFVAFLQAYVFAILSTVYISMSYPEE